MTKAVTDASFQQEVLEHKGYVMIDFWAEWCGPCRQLSPIIDELSQEMGDKVKIMKMNIDENPEIPSQMSIRGIPTMIIFEDGKQVAVKSGSLPKSNLKEWLESEIA